MRRRFEVGVLCVAVVAIAGCEIQSVKRGAVVPDPDAKPVTRTLRETELRWQLVVGGLRDPRRVGEGRRSEIAPLHRSPVRAGPVPPRRGRPDLRHN